VIDDVKISTIFYGVLRSLSRSAPAGDPDRLPDIALWLPSHMQ